MQPRRKSFLSTGITSIVLIFVLLCLLTFAVLSVVSARADYKLSEKNTTRTTEYYEAENTANASENFHCPFNARRVFGLP